MDCRLQLRKISPRLRALARGEARLKVRATRSRLTLAPDFPIGTKRKRPEKGTTGRDAGRGTAASHGRAGTRDAGR